MAWFDDPSVYYAAVEEHAPLAQGDIVIAPTAVFLPGIGEREAIAPTLGERRSVHIWRGADTGPITAAPALAAEVSWSLAMVLPHNCAMEKEWNERVVELRENGASQKEAEVQASSESDLDALVTIAPILRYDDVSAKRQRSIRSGSRLSAFPVVGTGETPEGYVDLNAATTVHFTLVLISQRVASLGILAQAHLQKKLAMHFAYRDDSDLDAIAKAIGRRIVDVMVVESPSKKSTRVKIAMTLEDGETLVLEGNAPPPRQEYIPERPARK